MRPLNDSQSRASPDKQLEVALQGVADKHVVEKLALDRHVTLEDRVVRHGATSEAGEKADEDQNEHEYASENANLLDKVGSFVDSIQWCLLFILVNFSFAVAERGVCV